MFLPAAVPRQTSADHLALAIESGDVYGLGLALEAAEGDEQEALATARAEFARLEGVARRFGAPGRGSVAVHYEEAKGGWVAHEMRVDASGRLTVKTKASLT